jgi:hypothetical protein
MMAASGKRGSNPRPLAWEANALPTELLPHTANVQNHWISIINLHKHFAIH